MKKFFTIILSVVLLFTFPNTVLAGGNNSSSSQSTKNLDDYILRTYGNKPTVSFLINRPVKESRLVIRNYGEHPVGHTFIRLDYGNGNAYYCGFYPDDEIKGDTDILNYIILQKDMKGSLTTNDRSPWNIGTTYEITTEQADIIKNFINNYSKNYNLITNSCTTFACDALIAAGITPPTETHRWNIPEVDAKTKRNLLQLSKSWWLSKENKTKLLNFLSNPKDQFYGYSPADAAQDIKSAGRVYYTNGYNGEGGDKAEIVVYKK